MAGFIPYRRQGANESGEVRPFIITDSTAITLGDAVRLTGGAGDNHIDVAAAGNRVLGVVVGFVDANGLPLDADAASFSGTRSGNAGNFGSETYTAASDNESSENVQALVDIDPNQEYYNDADGDFTVGDVGLYYDVVAASDQIDQSTEGTSGQFILLERDPHNDGDNSKGIFRIAEHALSL